MRFQTAYGTRHPDNADFLDLGAAASTGNSISTGVTTMKATQIRIILGLAAVLGIGVLAVPPSIGDHAAFADTVVPTGAFSAGLCSGTRATFRLGTAPV